MDEEQPTNRQFDVTYNESDHEQEQMLEEEKKEVTNQTEQEEEEEDPMEARLRAMKEELRNRFENEGSSAEKPAKPETHFEEDNQGYDDYSSPQRAKQEKPNV